MVLKKLLEYRIEVIRTNGIHDTGVLAAYDEQWIKLHKDNDKMLYIPLHEIRLVKVLAYIR